MKRSLPVVAVLVVVSLVDVFTQTPNAVPRTPWGDPDLQGVWTSEPELGVPFERAPELGDRQTYSDAEFEQRRTQAQKQLAADNAEFDVDTADTANAGAVGSATSPPPHWLERPAIAAHVHGHRAVERPHPGHDG